MNSRTSTFNPTANSPHLSRRPSISSRLSFAVSVAEQGDLVANGAHGQGQIEEEIAEIKRYEDFGTIDWVQDAAREHARRNARRKRAAGVYKLGEPGWRYRLWESYEAAQGWIVITIIGAAIGMNAAFLSIITEWLADIKTGYCTTGFYLNEDFCCWGESNGCEEWHHWTGFMPLDYLLYFFFAILFAFMSATLVKSYAPYAAGSGISEIKCIIAGFVMKGFLGFWTLVIKSVSLPLTIASGLSVGKEGPSVHYAVCTGNVISRLFKKYRSNASKTREILTACAAAGVAVAFGSPIGGVLFSLEEMASYFPLKTLWRSYFCALVATAVLSAMNPFRTGQLVMFQVQYDRGWHFFEIIPYVVLGVFGGLYGAFVIKWNLRAQSFRKKYLAGHAVLEATVLAAATALVAYPNAFLRIDMTESMKILFLECEGGEDYNGLCESARRSWNVSSLVFATVLRIFLVILSYGCKVPAGIFVPSMAVGATFGRAVGIVVQAIHEANPGSVFFSACKPDEPCITPGTYALLGAAAALSGIMHLTVCVVVIMIELTGALTYILPVMIVLGVTKAVSSLLGKGGIADRMIWFNGFPFLDSKEEHNLGVPVSQVMRTNVVSLQVGGSTTLAEVEQLLADDKYQGFPIVSDRSSRILVGYIGRTELRYAIDRARRERALAPDTKCLFAPLSTTQSSTIPVTPTTATFPVTFSGAHDDDDDNDDDDDGGGGGAAQPSSAPLNLGRFVDATPVTAHPRLPLETVMELFQKIGPRVILVEYQGRLTGLVTVKDCLKYQFKVEAAENPKDDDRMAEAHERLWGLLLRVVGWVSDGVAMLSGGRIRLKEDDLGRGSRRDDRILDGDEYLDGVELEGR